MKIRRIFNFVHFVPLNDFDQQAESYLISEGDIEDGDDQRDQEKARECKKQVEHHQSRTNLFTVNLTLGFIKLSSRHYLIYKTHFKIS